MCLYSKKGDINGVLSFSNIKLEYCFNNGEYIADIYAKIQSDDNPSVISEPLTNLHEKEVLSELKNKIVPIK